MPVSKTLAALALLGAFAVTAIAAEPPAGMSVKVLMRTAVSGDESREAIVASAEMQPGISTGRHTHPGDEYATVIEGELEIITEGQSPKRVKAGEAYHNARDVVHETRNVSSGVTRIVSTFIIARGEPIMKPIVAR